MTPIDLTPLNLAELQSLAAAVAERIGQAADAEPPPAKGERVHRTDFTIGGLSVAIVVNVPTPDDDVFRFVAETILKPLANDLTQLGLARRYADSQDAGDGNLADEIPF